jgi:hypothetical protein
MEALQARLNLEADLEKIRDEIDSFCWIIDPWPLKVPEFDVTMTSRIDRESYTLRIVAPDYPNEAPSIKCVNPDTKHSDDPRAWPKCDGFRLPNADLCLPISREGFQTHPEWRNSEHAWKSSGNPIYFALSTIQDLLNNSSRYHGRNT